LQVGIAGVRPSWIDTVLIANNLRLEKRDVVSVRVRKMFRRTSKEKDTVDRVKEREREKKI
jgi:hypothetical protein